MAYANVPLQAFNRGLVSRLALARTDLTRMGMSASVQRNLMPRSLGSMMLRPGLGYIGSTRGNLFAKHIPFVFSTTDTAALECTNGVMRVLVDEAPIVREQVIAAVTNGQFAADLSGWTDADEAGSASTWDSSGAMKLVGTDFAAAVRTQTIEIFDGGTEHAIRVVIKRNPGVLRLGSTDGGDEYIRETELGVGVHSLAFTPTDGSAYLRVSCVTRVPCLIDSIEIEGPGAVELPTPWLEADLRKLRCTQSADVIFVACDGRPQQRIERRARRSWSLVEYRANDGPFAVINTGPTTITPSATDGEVTLTASKPLFRAGHVGASFKITSIGQVVNQTFTADGQWSDPIKVTGIGTARAVTVTVAGIAGGTVLTLQRSAASPGSWGAVATYNSNGSGPYNDGLSDQIMYYRIGTATGGYGSGTPSATLTYSAGGLSGVARITAVASNVSASADVVKSLGGTTASSSWSEGAWSNVRGWPTAVELYEGRLWFAGRGSIWGSVSDVFNSFESTTEGDSGPISRTVGAGPVDTINWLLPMQRLIVGGQSAEISARSTSFDEPLTPTNFNIKDASTQGSAGMAAVKIDTHGLFVQRDRRRLMHMAYDFSANDYQTTDLTLLVPDIAEGNAFVMVAAQRQPDTRVHCLREDGTAAVMVFDPAEELRCWVEVETDGVVEDVYVLPGAGAEDRVYYVVRRTVNGQTVRYRERWAEETECRGGVVSKLADSHVVYSGAATDTVSVPHLDGETLVCWADGRDVGTVTVSGGVATLPAAASNIVVGIGYEARFQSTKLAYAAQAGSGLTQRKRLLHVGLILADTHARGLRYGPSFDVLDDLPMMEESAPVDPNSVWEAYDQDMIEFPGEWNTDSRICLVAAAPRPCTVLAAIIGVLSHETT